MADPISPDRSETGEIPAVWHVQIPDPDCKETPSKCRKVMLPVNGAKAQETLWQYDKTRDHVLDVEDMAGDPAAAIPSVAAECLADLVVGSQLIANTNRLFQSSQDLLRLVKTTLAVDQAHGTVQWLSNLPSHHVNSGFFGDETEYNATDWGQIEERLGKGGAAYAQQVSSAAMLYDRLVKSLPALQTRNESGDVVLAPKDLPHGLMSHLKNLSGKMQAVYDFAVHDEIECEGPGCPIKNESPHPYWP